MALSENRIVKFLSQQWRQHRRRSIIVGVLAVLFLWWLWPSGDDNIYYAYSQVTRGTVTGSVTATGKLSASSTVDIGSQVSGQIAAIHVDYNQQVKAGELLAKIDPSTFEAKVSQVRAELRVAEANLTIAEARRDEAAANFEKARRELDRKRNLVKQGHISEADLDKVKVEFEAAKAGLAVAEAEALNSAAQIEQRQASLDQAEVDLSRTDIRAPMDGVVLKVHVGTGQTLAASMQTPTLFTLAGSLSRMSVAVDVDEADIGLLREGQEASFTVDAYPDLSFEGKVSQVRRSPNDEENVVTYTVIVDAQNPDQKLFPGMTAQVKITWGEAVNVLMVDTAALHFTPRDMATSLEGEMKLEMQKQIQPGKKLAVVWQEGLVGLAPTVVETGISDNGKTELVGDSLAEGATVITGAFRTPPMPGR